MYLHQQRVLRNVLVSMGTGSGKTEAFLYPIVDELLRERDQGITKGLKAILIYPMNALANDQLNRLREMLAGTGVTFGQWISGEFEGATAPELPNPSPTPCRLDCAHELNGIMAEQGANVE